MKIMTPVKNTMEWKNKEDRHEKGCQVGRKRMSVGGRYG